MKNKNRIQAGLFFGIAMTLFFMFQDLLTNDHQTTNRIITSIISSLVGGVVGGVLFGWLIGKFANFNVLSKGIKIETQTGETILFETSANHCKGVEGVGGKLFMTNKRVIFKSHKLNIQNHQLSINLTDVKEVHRYKSLGVVNNGLSLTTISGKKERFVVEQADTWFHYLSDPTNLQQKSIPKK